MPTKSYATVNGNHWFRFQFSVAGIGEEPIAHVSARNLNKIVQKERGWLKEQDRQYSGRSLLDRESILFNIIKCNLR